MRKYSPSTGATYLPELHGGDWPADCIDLPDDVYQEVIANPPQDSVRQHTDQGIPFLIPAGSIPPTAEALCGKVDATADAARRLVAGDPLRAVEYERSASEAHAFKQAGYPANAVPRTVAAWAINGRTPQQAADSILAEAAAYTEALYQLREARLAAKEQIRTHMAAGQVAQAEQVAAQTIAAIEAAVAGIGNNA